MPSDNNYPQARLLAALAVAACLPAQVEDAALHRALAAYPHRILFESYRDGNWELYTANADGSSAVNLTRTDDLDETYGRVAPDGQWIAFCVDTGADSERQRDIHVMRVDGSDRTLLVDHARDPFWSRDCSELGYLPDEFERFSISAWATKGLRFYSFVTGESRAHPNAAIEHLYAPCWSDDGRWIVASVHGGLGFRHAVVAIAGDSPTVHDLGLAGCRPDLSPDNRGLAWGSSEFRLDRTDVDLLGLVPRAGAGSAMVRNSLRENMVYHVDWSPDGRYVAYTSGPRDSRRRLSSSRTPDTPGVEAEGWDVWVADTTATNVRVRITRDGRSNKEPDWIPIEVDSGDDNAPTTGTAK